ncbi:MAG: glycosyltransferase family 2 protein [Opitutaceae bacterium]|nr:glycosyltransferase family 2 protein [Opitutaceae bacterium]
MIPLLSFVVPCFNEEDVLRHSVDRLLAAGRALGETFEVVLVDDGSRDRTWAIIDESARGHAEVRGVRLSRNFGHQPAIMAGLEAARGVYVLVIDADLQDPPELAGPMLAEARTDGGWDVVFGQRRSRAEETWLKRATARVFYRMLNALADRPIPVDTGDFRLMSRRVVEALIALPERGRYLRGLVGWVGFRQKAFPYDRAPRAAGQTKYSWGRMLALAVEAVTSFSLRPLRLAIWLGGLQLGVSALVLAWALFSWARGHVVAGWTSMICVMLFIGGMQTLILGILGEYLGKLFIEAKRRPIFIVQETTASAGDAGVRAANT